MRLARLADRPESETLERCLASLDPDAPTDYRELAALLACEWAGSRPRRVGLGGGQGAGKSTLGRLLEAACSELGLRTCVLGIDDFYRTRAERLGLAERIHPLFETRGPPGTHDVAECGAALTDLARETGVSLPVFDKAVDDRVGTRSVEGPFDLIVLEGWCVGARPVEGAELAAPLNELEREEDRQGLWREHVNQQLATEYRALWGRLDQLVFLQVPSLAAVRRWRGQQELERPPERRLDRVQIDRFIQHYERVTLSMLSTLPGNVDCTVGLAEDHSVSTLEFGSWRTPPAASGFV